MIGHPKTRKREIVGLQKAAEELGCNVLKIITWDEEGEVVIQERNVQLVPCWKWLLGKS